MRAGQDSLVGKWRYEGDLGDMRDWSAARISHVPDSQTILETCDLQEEPDVTDDTQDDTTETGIVDTIVPLAGMFRSTNLDDDLIFQIADSGGQALFYRGRETADSIDLNHVTFRDSMGNLSAVIMHEYLPVQWIIDGLSMVVYRLESEEDFDPTRAVHVYVTPDTEDSLIVDIYPSNLDSTITEMERITGLIFSGARDYLADHGVSTFSQLVAMAESETGNDRLSAMAAATGFGLAHSACAIYARSGGLPKRTRANALDLIFKTTVKVGAAALANLLGAEFGPGSENTNGPTVGVFLCQGAAKYGVCHYMFFLAGPDQIGPCISFCQASLGCFTNICMPMDLSWEEARGFGNRQFGR